MHRIFLLPLLCLVLLAACEGDSMGARSTAYATTPDRDDDGGGSGDGGGGMGY